MEEIYMNVEYEKPVDPGPSTNPTGPRSSERRFHGAVVLCLGLLSVFLLAKLISLGVHYSTRGSDTDLSTIKANLTERLQASENKLSSVSAERDLLNASLTEKTKELDRLQSLSKENHDSIRRSAAELAAIKANLTEERDRLNASLIETTKELKNKGVCPAGWRGFSCACYLLSEESGSWENGREDCREREADLVVIGSSEEQMFLSNFTERETQAWIGLTDRVEERTWMWIDGAPLSLKYWLKTQPDNGGGHGTLGEEDCAHIITGGNNFNNWNDLSCNTRMRWICEKMV